MREGIKKSGEKAIIRTRGLEGKKVTVSQNGLDTTFPAVTGTNGGSTRRLTITSHWPPSATSLFPAHY